MDAFITGEGNIRDVQQTVRDDLLIIEATLVVNNRMKTTDGWVDNPVYVIVTTIEPITRQERYKSLRQGMRVSFHGRWSNAYPLMVNERTGETHAAIQVDIVGLFSPHAPDWVTVAGSEDRKPSYGRGDTLIFSLMGVNCFKFYSLNREHELPMPELRTVQVNQKVQKVVDFDVAVRLMGDDGKRSKTQAVRVALWDRLAETAASALYTGAQLSLDGRINKATIFTDGRGQDRVGIEITGHSLNLPPTEVPPLDILDMAPESKASALMEWHNERRARREQRQQTDTSENGGLPDLSDIPF